MRRNPQIYALTAVCWQRRRVFQRPAIAELMIATIFRYRDQGRFLLHGFVVMPDHVHLLLTPTDTIEKTAQLIKGGFSFAVRKHYPGEIWQDSFHAHRIVDAEDYENQLSYIANNPTKKGLTNYPYIHTRSAYALNSTTPPQTPSKPNSYNTEAP